MEDLRLLREYSEAGSEKAFATLVNRHIALVYSAALRRLGDPQAAEDITQSVFTLLARKARRLGPRTVLAGWLHRAVCLATAKYWRTESRRRRHEQEATTMIYDTPAPEVAWAELTPHLDDALNRLNDEERLAVLLRFFQSKPFQEVGQALGITEDAARMRVNRALERLRLSLQHKEVACTTAALETLLAGNIAEAVPASLASTVGTNALRAAGAAGTASSLAFLLALVAREKLKTAAAIGAVGAVTFTGALGLRLLHLSGTTELPPEARNASAVAPPAFDNETTETLQPAITQGAPTILAGSETSVGDTQPSLTARQLYERGLVHQREKRYDEALADLTKSIDLLERGIGRWSWYSDVYFSRASVFADKKNYASAVADLTRLLEFKPKNYSTRFNRAGYFKALGQTDAAIADYSAIVEDPETDFSNHGGPKERCLGMTYEYRGLIYEDRKEDDKAVADFTESLRVDPSGGDTMIVYWRRGLRYRASQQIDKALEDANALSEWALQWALAADSKDSDRYRALTAARFGSEIFEHQLPFQLEVLAATHAKAGEFRQAITDQQRAMKLLTPATEDQRPAMQARLERYQAGKPLMRD